MEAIIYILSLSGDCIQNGLQPHQSHANEDNLIIRRQTCMHTAEIGMEKLHMLCYTWTALSGRELKGGNKTKEYK
jgi:hypothetical protein